jgi:DNA-binding GntR family transcriptional regulator
LWELTDRYRVVLVSGDAHLLAAAREHVKIAEAMRERQPRRVRSLIRAHIVGARSLIEDALE